MEPKQRFVKLRLTIEEANQLHQALGNNSGDGDWLDYLKNSKSTAKEIRAYKTMIEKVNKALPNRGRIIE